MSKEEKATTAFRLPSQAITLARRKRTAIVSPFASTQMFCGPAWLGQKAVLFASARETNRRPFGARCDDATLWIILDNQHPWFYCSHCILIIIKGVIIMNKIMIVEDDTKIAELLHSHIEKYGYEATITKDFNHVLDLFHNIMPDLVLLDVNLPSFDGYYWCRQIRSISTCPIIFISARAGEMDQVMALENGADDYITKPFYYDVVMAKIRSHLRRAYGAYAPKMEERIVEQAGLTLYPERMELKLGEQITALTKKEAVLLETLLKRFPRVVSRETLLEKLWDDQSYVDDNTLNVNITRVRKKLQELGIHDAIETVRGAGYRFNVTYYNGETE
ncbi:response regulator protein GraR family protein [Aneurinibacillus aneurinilyticus ATCC 12856]|uniref:Response regulator protein GraR family protein n=2 Tax=Aneurinibacillus aneurinilyticus TaxID=1391 RepID=U1WZG4_ANEAE|nr:response regulator protein GraR family protein [Aneurinibacillus aneurinilyticus ATCC 12856]